MWALSPGYYIRIHWRLLACQKPGLVFIGLSWHTYLSYLLSVSQESTVLFLKSTIVLTIMFPRLNLSCSWIPAPWCTAGWHAALPKFRYGLFVKVLFADVLSSYWDGSFTLKHIGTATICSAWGKMSNI